QDPRTAEGPGRRDEDVPGLSAALSRGLSAGDGIRSAAAALPLLGLGRAAPPGTGAPPRRPALRPRGAACDAAPRLSVARLQQTATRRAGRGRPAALGRRPRRRRHAAGDPVDLPRAAARAGA